MEQRVVEFNGDTYIRNPKSRYYFKHTTRNSERKGARQLHRAVWEFYNGPIPDGCHIHHIDGDIDNNDISNLECITAAEHLSMHGRKNYQDPEFRRKALENLDAVRGKAAEWHSSQEGIEWHRQHTAESLAKTWDKVECTCEVCGKKYIATKRSHYCSQKCQRRARAAKHGHIVKEEVRACLWCGKTYKATNGIQRYCSKQCSYRARASREKKSKETK